ncbi:MAG: leucine-rich repeat-containing protein kinase family protein [Rhodocyclaceae bacterium]|nr:leucine-rich repeat-containing protein kinase family protein [Rhodocyclaceae bacterium]
MSATGPGVQALAALRAGGLRGAQRLDLRGAGLTALPPEVFALADTLEVLDLSGNQLCELPDDLHRLRRLRILFGSDNAFTGLPAAIGACPQLEMAGFKANRIADVPRECFRPGTSLRWLILTDNAIEALPDTLGHCTRMQKLMLAGNRLAALPDSLADCERLELLRIAANCFEALPDWLDRLPRLSWLACAGNPFNAALEAAALADTPIAMVPWAELTVGERLGEGASGVIHAAQHRGAAGESAVALKLFKGEVTSDGWPLSEMAASLAAGAAPHTVRVRGRLAGHPQGTEGLVLERIGPDWRNLAGPPSLASCTRDVYAEGLRLPGAAARAIACDIAAAVAHLHARGMVHGDLYAHNILWRAGEALLGDFGAAALLPEALALAVQRTESRAFGCLLEELLAHAEVPDGRADLTDLAALRDACLAGDPAARPTMAQVHANLAS